MTSHPTLDVAYPGQLIYVHVLVKLDLQSRIVYQILENDQDEFVTAVHNYGTQARVDGYEVHTVETVHETVSTYH